MTISKQISKPTGMNATGQITAIIVPFVMGLGMIVYPSFWRSMVDFPGSFASFTNLKNITILLGIALVALSIKVFIDCAFP